MKEVIGVSYTSQLSTYNKFRIKLRIPNYFGYVKDVKAHFNRLGEKPGQYGICILKFSKDESTDKESVFIGSREFQNVGYMTFYIELTINDNLKRIVRDPISYNPVFANTDNMPFFEMFVYNGNASVPKGYAGGIMYQAFIDTFYREGAETDPEWINGEPKWRPDDDGVYRNDRHFRGNIKGLIKKLPYIATLGTTILYITPVFDSPSQNGYDIRDYKKVKPIFGTWNDLKELRKKCNRLGIMLVGDCVFNHCSRENPLFVTKPDIFDWDVKYEVPKTWWGYEHLVEFNKSHPGYFEELKEWLLLYAEYFDGIRLDVADSLPDYVLEFIHKYFLGYILGEVWKNGVKGDFRGFFFGNELHAQMNYLFPNAIYRYIRYGNHRYFKKTVLYDVYYLYPRLFMDVCPIFLTSHDIPRMPNILVGDYMKEDPMFENIWDMEKHGDWFDGDIFNTLRFRLWEYEHDHDFDIALAKRLMRLALFMSYTLPGIPVIYAGDEMFMTGYKDPNNRKPLPWHNIDKETYNYYVRIGRFRAKYNRIFAHGEFDILESTRNLLVYRRDNMIFIVNRSNEEIDISEYHNLRSVVFDTEGNGQSINHASSGVYLKPKCAVALLGE